MWLGVLAYVGYTYLYTFAIAWDRLFLVYMTLLSLTGFAIVRALTAPDPRQVAGRSDENTPGRGMGLFLWVAWDARRAMGLYRIRQPGGPAPVHAIRA